MTERIVLISSILIAVGTIVWALIFHYNLYKNQHYICRNCSNLFQPATFSESLWGLNAFDERKLKCPHCNKKVWAKETKKI